ncbi:hypothetical protein [Alcaligenes sp. Marseille-Q7550]
MSALAYLFLIFCVFGLAGMLDSAWLRVVRPRLAARYGWQPSADDWHIPNSAWVGCCAIALGLYVTLRHVAPAAGF